MGSSHTGILVARPNGERVTPGPAPGMLHCSLSTARSFDLASLSVTVLKLSS